MSKSADICNYDFETALNSYFMNLTSTRFVGTWFKYFYSSNMELVNTPPRFNPCSCRIGDLTWVISDGCVCVGWRVTSILFLTKDKAKKKRKEKKREYQAFD